MLHRKPRKGECIVYQPKYKPATEYIVTGYYKDIPEILTIKPADGGDSTTIIWMHKDGPNPFLHFKNGHKCEIKSRECIVCAFRGLTNTCVWEGYP